eukprot:m.99444 g.99444  ORF g.99444 m.99444 type:complete len:384 (+) comp20621_c0_seq2:472-1623(+)
MAEGSSTKWRRAADPFGNAYYFHKHTREVQRALPSQHRTDSEIPFRGGHTQGKQPKWIPVARRSIPAAKARLSRPGPAQASRQEGILAHQQHSKSYSVRDQFTAAGISLDLPPPTTSVSLPPTTTYRDREQQQADGVRRRVMPVQRRDRLKRAALAIQVAAARFGQHRVFRDECIAFYEAAQSNLRDVGVESHGQPMNFRRALIGSVDNWHMLPMIFKNKFIALARTSEEKLARVGHVSASTSGEVVPPASAAAPTDRSAHPDSIPVVRMAQGQYPTPSPTVTPGAAAVVTEADGTTHRLTEEESRRYLRPQPQTCDMPPSPTQMQLEGLGGVLLPDPPQTQLGDPHTAYSWRFTPSIAAHPPRSTNYPPTLSLPGMGWGDTP